MQRSSMRSVRTSVALAALMGCGLVCGLACGTTSNTHSQNLKLRNSTGTQRGLKVRVSPTFIVMNSYDGEGHWGRDNSIELYGWLSVGGKRVWSRSYFNELSLGKGEEIRGQSVDVEVLDSDPTTWRIEVEGQMHDSDQPRGNNALVWKSDTILDLKDVMDKQDGVITISGEEDNEYANLQITAQRLLPMSEPPNNASASSKPR